MAVRRDEQEQHTQQSGSEGRSAASTSTSTARGGAGATQASGGASSGSSTRGDQERSREVSRERAPTGSAMQQGNRPMGRDLATRRGGSSQPTILPAMMANPGLMTRALLANPFAFAQAMSEEMDRVFSMADRGELWQQVGQPGQGRQTTGGWSPALEVVQKEHEIVVCADLPGLKPDDVQIEIDDHVLTISGERRERHEDRRDGGYRSERSYGSFTRSLALPEGVNEDQVTANFEHGELEIRIPLPDQQKPRGRRVQIQSGASNASPGSSANAGGANAGGANAGAAGASTSTPRAGSSSTAGTKRSDQQQEG